MSVDRLRPVPDSRRTPGSIKGLGKLLGLTGTQRDLSPQTQMSLLLARTRPDMQVYAGTVPHAEVLRRRAKNRRARAARRISRSSR